MLEYIKNLFKKSEKTSGGITIKAEAPIIDNALKFGNTLLGLFRDTKGKLSSKRTVTGLLASAAVADMQIHGLTDQNLILSGIAVIPILFTCFEKS